MASRITLWHAKIFEVRTVLSLVDLYLLNKPFPSEECAIWTSPLTLKAWLGVVTLLSIILVQLLSTLESNYIPPFDTIRIIPVMPCCY